MNLDKPLSLNFECQDSIDSANRTPITGRTRVVKPANNSSLLDEVFVLTEELSSSLNSFQHNAQSAIQRIQTEIRAAQRKLEVGDTSTVSNTTDLTRLWPVIEKCFEQTDVQEAIDQQLLEEPWTDEEKFHICVVIAEKMYAHKDPLQAISWINQARLFLTTVKVENATQKYRDLSELAARFGQPNLAIDLIVESSFSAPSLNNAQKENLKTTYEKLRVPNAKKHEHGHDLLLEYLRDNPHQHVSTQKKPVMIEIGTTRENVPGQGSTLQLAALAAKQGIQFISVDMDPHNSRWARFNLELMQLPGETVSQKGEDFLAQYPNTIEYIFLDAYDFDHGNHSELRQQRYQKYLGSNIDELQCHQMHLDCAKTLLEKLSPTGVICVDDTWQDDEGHWTAKGTLAVPFLLENGFKIIEARNRAVLMNREGNA